MTALGIKKTRSTSNTRPACSLVQARIPCVRECLPPILDGQVHHRYQGSLVASTRILDKIFHLSIISLMYFLVYIFFLAIEQRRKLHFGALRAEGDCSIKSSSCIRYLGLHIDSRLRFDQHLRIVSEKAARLAEALAKIMPNTVEPRSSRRELYAHVIDSILLYGVPIWRIVTETQAYICQAEAVHRQACLRVISGRPRVSYDATYVIANVPPLALLADERARIYQLPRTMSIDGFADDIALTIFVKKLEDIKVDADDAIRLVRRALNELGLQTADQKTEVLLVTSRKWKESITFRAGDCDITTVPSILYLVVHIDDKLRFDKHLKVVSEKAARVAGALSGLMSNFGGPRCRRRKLYVSVVDSVLLYGASTWRDATGTHSYVRKAASIHRCACLRAICGFRSISHEAVHVFAGTPPLVLFVDECSRLYEHSCEDARSDATSEERTMTLEK
ncbi:unnamed protein product [Trichogramma brassicae]|uniref:Reverse transcriptase domain-containing protein n=1 Tax=Trichogramma brassicae TaxID=86971 RepID=A0A6H5J453_9HYME|nr:unnamed protein product [Trichogramma brassicae]